MSKEKKLIREKFRIAVFKRDGYKCCFCKNDKEILDAHHIQNREAMPAGGYVAANGISLCPDCHIKAEKFYETGIAFEGFSPEELYKRIRSSYEKAYEDSLKLEKTNERGKE